PEESPFSPAFQESMAALLRRERRRKATRRRSRWAAALTLICLASLAVWSVSQAQAGKAAVTWSRQALSDGVMYSFSGAAPEKALPSYRLSWLPEGYQETMRSEGEDAVRIRYSAAQGDGQALSLQYFYAGRRDSFHLTMNRTDYTCKTVTVDGWEADLYLPMNEGEDAILLWLDGEEGILFCLTGPFSETVLLRATESLELAE
ncbi:MAG: DUF4367 domain-containing protein, partial [Oscillospiraceae bacterium]|nr:DUF4367 domain-containing protein [Oscillospiraceae bacterium]